ncbi:uncharacterized protein LOC126381189 [Pectinophora gossypiella]|uniref:uncharacterized protein LOC126381189 n=1 Tax=Pectinophora gossypiella TaxID=13191 RepID=UPI00214F2DE7|nr:uncharacterized protein LOC126381189 [Pectinophora gossypiella]
MESKRSSITTQVNQVISGSRDNGLFALHAHPRRASGSRGGRGGGIAARQPSSNCYCSSCGASDHFAVNCKFQNYVCSKCGIIGHLRRVCTVQRAGQQGGSRPRMQRGGPGGMGSTRAHFVHGEEAPECRRCTDSGGAGAGAIVEENYNDDDYEEPVMQMSLSNYRPIP